MQFLDELKEAENKFLFFAEYFCARIVSLFDAQSDKKRAVSLFYASLLFVLLQVVYAGFWYVIGTALIAALVFLGVKQCLKE